MIATLTSISPQTAIGILGIISIALFAGLCVELVLNIQDIERRRP